MEEMCDTFVTFLKGSFLPSTSPFPVSAVQDAKWWWATFNKIDEDDIQGVGKTKSKKEAKSLDDFFF